MTGQVLNRARRLRRALARNVGVSNAPLPFGDVRPGPATLVATSAPGLTQVPLPLASHHGVHVDRRAEGRRDRPAVRRVPAGRFPVLEGTPHRPLSRRSAVRSRTCTFFPRSAHVLRATSPRSPAGRQPSGAQGSAVRSRCTAVYHVALWCTTVQPPGGTWPQCRCTATHGSLLACTRTQRARCGLALPFSVRLPRQEVARGARTPLPQHVGSAAAQTADKRHSYCKRHIAFFFSCTAALVG